MAKKIPTWVHDGETYRVVRFIRMVAEYGYAEKSEEHYNVLQRKLRNPLAIIFNLSLWEDVEEEHVPSFAWISAATLGYTTWKSALLEKCRIDRLMPKP